MSDAEGRLRDLHERVAAAQRARVRAEQARDAAVAAAATARRALADEFGVSTVTEARDVLDTLTAERDDAIVALTEALDRIGA